VVLSGGLPAADLSRAKSEPRMLFRLAERNLPQAEAGLGRKQFDWVDGGAGRSSRRKKQKLKIDWSVPLGTGIVAPNMFPAKYSFDVNATPNCTNDYVVFGLNVAGSAGRPTCWA
jgi:hypothetical protein